MKKLFLVLVSLMFVFVSSTLSADEIIDYEEEAKKDVASEIEKNGLNSICLYTPELSSYSIIRSDSFVVSITNFFDYEGLEDISRDDFKCVNYSSSDINQYEVLRVVVNEVVDGRTKRFDLKVNDKFYIAIEKNKYELIKDYDEFVISFSIFYSVKKRANFIISSEDSRIDGEGISDAYIIFEEIMFVPVIMKDDKKVLDMSNIAVDYDGSNYDEVIKNNIFAGGSYYENELNYYLKDKVEFNNLSLDDYKKIIINLMSEKIYVMAFNDEKMRICEENNYFEEQFEVVIDNDYTSKIKNKINDMKIYK